MVVRVKRKAKAPINQFVTECDHSTAYSGYGGIQVTVTLYSVPQVTVTLYSVPEATANPVAQQAERIHARKRPSKRDVRHTVAIGSERRLDLYREISFYRLMKV